MAIDGETIKKNISKNITKYREKSGLSQKEFAKALGTSPSRVSNWEQGANCPSIDILFDVCKILKVSINDIYGVYPESSIMLSYDEQEHIKKYRNLDVPGRKHVDAVLQWESERMVQLQHATALSPGLPSSVRLIQYYQHLASAGNGEYLFDDIPADLIAVPDTPISRKADFVIGVSGDSMAPTYHDGDKVYVQKVDKIPVGSIGIFVRGTDCFIKELGSDRLISHNKEYPDIPAGEDIRLVGMVLGKVEDSRE